MTCEWASCHAPATTSEDGWPFCATHHRAHIDLARTPGGILGSQAILTKDVDPRPNRMLTRQQLLDAVLAEAARPVPPVPGHQPIDRARNTRGRRLHRTAA